MLEYLDIHSFLERNTHFKAESRTNILHLLGVNKDAYFFLRLLHIYAPHDGFRFRFIDDDLDSKASILDYFQTLGPCEKFLSWLEVKYVGWTKPIGKASFETSEFSQGMFVLCSDARRHQYAEILRNVGISHAKIFTWREYLVFRHFGNDDVYIPRIDFTVTYDCTLTCSYCNMFVPDAKVAQIRNTRTCEDFENFLAALEGNKIRVGILHFVGGEPFLNRDLPKLIQLAIHSDRFDLIWCTTNGTLVRDLLPSVTKSELNRVNIFITDYSEALPAVAQKTEKVISFQRSRISNGLIVSREKEWQDFGHPKQVYETDTLKRSDHFKRCTAPYRGFRDGRLYYCNLSLAAIETGLAEEQVADSICIDNVSPAELLAYDLGMLGLASPELCGSCSGCNTGKGVTVSPSDQGIRERKNEFRSFP